MRTTKTTASEPEDRNPEPQPARLVSVELNHPVNTKITNEWVDLTPDLAEKWLGRNHGNRNVRPLKVKSFARDMRNGNWGTTGEAIKFDWLGNMVDGQHRCEAVIESGSTIRVLVIRNLDPEVRQVIDTGSKRTPADAIRFAGITGNVNVMAAVARLALGRENGYLRTAMATTAPNITNQETVDWVLAHPEIAHAVAVSYRTGTSIGIPPSVWAYCLYEISKVNAPFAVEFATSTAEFRDLRGKGDPRNALLTTFRNAQLGKRRKPGNGETIYIVFRAWNAWVTNKSLTQIIPMSASGVGNDIPKVLAPTEAFLARYSGEIS